jgi:hypothetical protein
MLPMAKPEVKKAVLVLPDVGIPEESLESFKEEFQSSVVGTIRRNALRPDDVVVVVVVVVVEF